MMLSYKKLWKCKIYLTNYSKRKRFCIFSWTKWGKRFMKKLEMQSFVFWLMKQKIHKIKNKWLLFYDLLTFRVFYESALLVLYMFYILLLQHLKKKFVMCSLDITCISSIYNVTGMMKLLLYMAHGTDYEFYFLEIALIHIMYIALPTDYN